MQRAIDVVQRQILLTLSYSHVFDQPLTELELKKRLILPSSKKLEASDENFVSALSTLYMRKLLNRVEGYWQLRAVQQDLFLIRKRRTLWSNTKLRELQPFLTFTKKMGWVKGVAITGSVSVRNAKEKDDVDVMIIAQRKRLWLVRPLLVMFSFLHGKRRSWNHEEYNSWCLNLWLDEDSLQVHPASRSLYVAYEVCQAEWVVSKGKIQEQFLIQNRWVQQFLPEYYSSKCKSFTTKKFPVTVRETFNLLDAINQLAYSVQLWYMKQHMTREKVSLSFAFFHPRDTKKAINNKWKSIIWNLVLK